MLKKSRQICVSLALLGTCIVQADTINNTRDLKKDNRSAAISDWRQHNQGQQQTSSCDSPCSGQFVSPLSETESSNPEHSSINIEADNAVVNMKKGIATFNGDVVLSQGWRQIETDSIQVDQNQLRYKLDGHVTIREPNMLLKGGAAEYDNNTSQLNISDASYVFHEQGIHGSSSQIQRDAQGNIVISDATYSTCEPENETWQLEAGKVTLHPDTQWGEAKNLKIRIADTPVFYAPYINFPIGDQRKSGLLYPTLGINGNDGFQYGQPIYWNIAPNRDATINTNISANRGPSLDSEFRQLTQTSYSQLNSNIARDSELGETRWSYDLQHQGDWGLFYSNIDYRDVSDSNFFSDFDSSLQAQTRTHLRQQLEFGARQRTNQQQWQLSVSFNDYEALRSPVRNAYQEKPRINFNLQQQYHVFDSPVTYTASAQWVDFSQDSNTSQIPRPFQLDQNNHWVEGLRFDTHHKLQTEFRNEYSFLDVALYGDHIQYRLDTPVAGNNQRQPNTTSFSASIGGGLIFERFNDHGGLLQQLKPEFYYQYRPERDQSKQPIFDTERSTQGYRTLFSQHRYIGGDRISEEHKLSIGVSHQWLDSHQQEYASLSIGQSFYLRELNQDDPLNSRLDANPNTKKSDIIIEGQLQLNRQWQARSALFIDPDERNTQRTDLELNYRTDNTLFNIGYYQDKQITNILPQTSLNFPSSLDIENNHIRQIDISGQYHISKNWSLLGRSYYDLANQRGVQWLAGMTYQGCCWRMSLSWNRQLEADNNRLQSGQPLVHESGILLSFQLIGLGGIGQKAEKLYKESIFGYQSTP